MKPILRATAVLGSSSAVSILVGLVSAKVLATLLGPNGLGFVGLIGGLFGLVNLLAGLGVGTGVVRMVANAEARGDQARVAALRLAARIVLSVTGGLAAVVLVVFREPISRWTLGGPEHGTSVVLVGLVVLLSVAGAVQGSTLNAYHRIGALAKIGIIQSVFGTALSLALIWAFGERGIVPGMLGGAALSFVVTRYFWGREVPPLPARATIGEVGEAVRSMVRFGVPFTGSMLVGGGVQLLFPTLVLHTLDQASVGYYRAAQGIAVGYFGFLLAAMAQDYFPRISAVSHDPAALIELANLQHRLLMLLGIPIVLGMLAIAPYLVPLIYSPAFTPTVRILEWQLVGDLLRLPSWTMAYIILARSGGATYFLTEFVGGSVMLLGSWLGIRWFGLTGLGIGFFAANVAYYAVVWLVLRRQVGFAWTTENKLMLGAALAAALGGQLLATSEVPHLRTAVTVVVALVAGLASLRALWAEISGGLGGFRWWLWRRQEVG